MFCNAEGGKYALGRGNGEIGGDFPVDLVALWERACSRMPWLSHIDIAGHDVVASEPSPTGTPGYSRCSGFTGSPDFIFNCARTSSNIAS